MIELNSFILGIFVTLVAVVLIVVLVAILLPLGSRESEHNPEKP